MSEWLASEQIRSLAEEDSVRGFLVRRALKEAEGAEEDALRHIEKAMRMLLNRFQSIEDGR